MKPTTFLKKRVKDFSGELSGSDTVKYYRFTGSGSENDLTGEVSNADAYSADAIDVPALIDYAPSDMLRKKFGKDLSFSAVLYIIREHLTDLGIEINEGDAFVLPDEDSKYIIKKVKRDMQKQSNFLRLIVAVDKGTAGRG